MTIDDVVYFIEPVDEHQANDQGHHLHIVYKPHPISEQIKRRKCGTPDNWEDAWKERFRELLLKDSKKVKVRGLTSEHRYLEVLVVADKKFIEFHKSRDRETYILTVMNMVSL